VKSLDKKETEQRLWIQFPAKLRKTSTVSFNLLLQFYSRTERPVWSGVWLPMEMNWVKIMCRYSNFSNKVCYWKLFLFNSYNQ